MLETLKKLGVQAASFTLSIVKVLVAIPFLVIAYIVVVVATGVIVINVFIVSTVKHDSVYAMNAVSRVFRIVAYRMEKALC